MTWCETTAPRKKNNGVENVSRQRDKMPSAVSKSASNGSSSSVSRRSLNTTSSRHREKKRSLPKTSASVRRRKKRSNASETCKRRPQTDNQKSMSSVLSALSKKTKERLESRRDKRALRGRESSVRWKRLARSNSRRQMQDSQSRPSVSATRGASISN